jgi:hypothetical protein
MDDDQVNERSIEQSESDIIYEEVQASLLPESDTDSEEEPDAQTETEPYALSLINLQTLHRYEYIMILYAQRFGLQTLLFLQLLWTIFSRASTATQKVSMGVLRSIQTQMYVFFQGSYYPYRAQTTMLAGPGIAPVEWYYNADTKVFISSTVYNSTNEYQTYHLEWLAAEVKYNDLVLYDISDYIQQVRWAGAERPRASLVMTAWSIHSGIVLNFRDGLNLKTINEDGTESSLPLRG